MTPPKLRGSEDAAGGAAVDVFTGVPFANPFPPEAPGPAGGAAKGSKTDPLLDEDEGLPAPPTALLLSVFVAKSSDPKRSAPRRSSSSSAATFFGVFFFFVDVTVLN